MSTFISTPVQITCKSDSFCWSQASSFQLLFLVFVLSQANLVLDSGSLRWTPRDETEHVIQKIRIRIRILLMCCCKVDKQDILDFYFVSACFLQLEAGESLRLVHQMCTFSFDTPPVKTGAAEILKGFYFEGHGVFVLCSHSECID